MNYFEKFLMRKYGERGVGQKVEISSGARHANQFADGSGAVDF